LKLINEMKALKPIINEISLTQHLLSVLSPFDEPGHNPRRFTCLGRLLAESKNLHLHDGKRNVSEEEKDKIWKSLLEETSSLPADDRLKIMRAFAILYWDWARECQHKHGDGDKKLTSGAKTCYSRANFLWRLVLTDTSFWNHFAREHDIGDSRVTEDTYDVTRRQVVDEILQHHLERARELTRKLDFEGARFHYECLCGWDRPSDSFPDEYSISGDFNSAEAQRIQKRSNDLISEWVSDMLSNANKHLNDTGDKSLPEGISRDFEGAMSVVDPALEVMPNSRRILLFAVKQRNDWCYQLAIAKRRKQAKEVIEKAIPRAENLAKKYLREGNSLDPDNQAVYLTYNLAWQLEEKHEKIMDYMNECKRWGGKDEEIEFQMQRQLVHQAIEEERFGDALNIIYSMDSRHRSDNQIRQLQALCYFKRGIDRAGKAMDKAGEINKSPESFFSAWRERGQPRFEEVEQLYREAYEDMCRAGDLVSPNELEIVKGYQIQLEEAKDEVRYHIILNEAHKILADGKEEYFSKILPPLEAIPENSKSLESARAIGSNLHFQIGINLANKSNYSSAEIHMQKAINLNPDEPLLRNQAAMFYQAYAYWEVKQANDKIDAIASDTDKFIKEYSDLCKFDILGSRIPRIRPVLLRDVHTPADFSVNIPPNKLKAFFVEQTEVPDSDIAYAEKHLESAVRHIRLAYENALSSDQEEIQRQLIDIVGSAGADIPLDKLMDKLDIKKSLKRDMEQIEEAYRGMRINLLLGAAHKVLEKDDRWHYEVFILLLENAPESAGHKKIINQLLAGLYFRLGIEEANNGNYRKAEEDLEKSLSFDPENDVIKEQLETIRRIRSEEGIVNKFIVAQKVFESGNYEKARKLCENIPRDFSHYNEVRQFLGLVYFKLGEKAVKNENLDEAIMYMEKSDNCSPGNDIIRRNLRDLKDLKRQGGFAGLKRKKKRMEEGFEKANQVAKILDMSQKSNLPLTPSIVQGFLNELEKAVEMTDHHPDIVHLRDMLKDALGRRY